jgi:acetoin utilization protein AcuB
MLVSLWMSRPPITIRPDASIGEAAVAMDRRHIRRLLVTVDGTPAGRLIGIVSAGDVGRAFPRDVNPHSVVVADVKLTRTVREVMTARPTTVTPTTPIEEAAALLRTRKVGALPVVHGDHAVGILTESDVFRAFVEMLGVEGPSVRVTFDVAGGEDVFALVVQLARAHQMRVASVLTATHEGRPMAVVRLAGAHAERFVDAVARSGHRLVSVLVTPA